MDYPSPPSPKGPTPQSFYSQDDYYYAADNIPQSRSDMNQGRPVSGIQDPPHMRAIDGDSDMKPPPSYKDMAPGLGKSYQDPPVDAGYAKRGPGAVIDDDEKPYSIGDLAAAHKITSGTVGTAPYDQDVKIPSTSDFRPHIVSSGNQQGGYQFSSGPPSYNGDHFARFN